jgi:hypothetical protein
MDSLVHELADHPTPAFLENLVRVMKHIMQQWQAEFEWNRVLDSYKRLSLTLVADV